MLIFSFFISSLLEPTSEQKITEEKKKQEELIKLEEERKKTEELLTKQNEERKQKELEEQRQRELAEKERQKREKEEYMHAEQPDYITISRYPNEFKNKKVKFYGKVIQIVEQNNNAVAFRMYVTSICNEYGCKWDDDIYVIFNKGDNMNILENDELEIAGDFMGIETYQTILGSRRSIPKVRVKYLKLN